MIELQLKDFEAYHQYQPWYGKSVITLLERINFEELRDDYKEQVIRILAHMNQWKNFVVEKLKGNRNLMIKIDTTDDWPNNMSVDLATFQQLKEEYRKLHKEFIKQLKAVDDFKEDVDDKYSKRYMVLGMMQHDIYHIGQLALLTK